MSSQPLPSWLILSSENVADAAAGLYWYANDYHEGQSSVLYSILSTSPYKPGRMERSCDRGCAMVFYNALKDGTLDPEMLRDSIKLILDTNS